MRRWLLVLVIATSACAGNGGTLKPAPPTSSTIPTVKSITPAEVQLLVDAGATTILDVRTEAEFGGGHLPGAVLADFEAPGFDAEVDELPIETTIVVYSNGDARAISAAQRLLDLGFSDVRDLVGGLDAWVNGGYALASTTVTTVPAGPPSTP